MPRVMIASMDSQMLDLFSALAEGLGCEAVVVVDGQEALESAALERPDLVFADVSLPVFDGFELCERLRRDPDLSPPPAVLLVSANDIDPRKIERADASGSVHPVISAAEMRELLSVHLEPGSY
jgi:CheY-like chemotaxis protein